MISNITFKITNPKKLNKYVISVKAVFKFAIYLVPPHNGQGFPVICLYVHFRRFGNIFSIILEKKGKKITYMLKPNIVKLKYI